MAKVTSTTLSPGFRLEELRVDREHMERRAAELRAKLGAAIVAGKPSAELDTELARAERDLANIVAAVAIVEPAAAAEAYERRTIELTAQCDAAIAESDALHDAAMRAKNAYDRAQDTVRETFAAVNAAARASANGTSLRLIAIGRLEKHLGVDAAARDREEAATVLAGMYGRRTA